MSVPSLAWEDLPHESFRCDGRILQLRWTLVNGQAFRWRGGEDGWWIGVAQGAVLRIRADGDTLTYSAFPRLPGPNFWQSYFRLDFDLGALYAELAGVDPQLDYAFSRWPGMRILRQDPTETITSFLCTTANSIPRITRAIDGMSRRWGRPIATIDGVTYHAFPEPHIFTQEIIPDLERDCNLGYRAFNLVRATEEIAAKPEGWALGLRDAPYSQAKAELMSIRGIGPKIADCVALFSLDKDEAVPVDTHVRQIAMELYLPEIKAKTLTASAYNRIADFYRQRFGPAAGWVQQYLFYWHIVRQRGDPLMERGPVVT